MSIELPTGNLMQVHLKALGVDGKVIFEGNIEVDALKLMVVAESKEEFAKSKGRIFTEAAVPFLVTELLQAAMKGASGEELHRMSINVAVSAWLAASIYGDVTAEEFLRSNLHFTLLANGSVKFDRIARKSR